jgi:hypothetical protein
MGTPAEPGNERLTALTALPGSSLCPGSGRTGDAAARMSAREAVMPS